MNIIYSQKLSLFNLQHGFSTKSYSYNDQILFPKQNHTNNVIIDDYSDKKEADAIVTKNKNMRIGIKTADCVPILLYEPNKKIVAAVHAGWKGTSKQIVKKTIREITKMGGNPKDIIACLGPAIGDCCYDIPSDRSTYFDTEFLTKRSNKIFLNLKKVNIQQLLQSNISLENIESMPWCTSCRSDMFFSYRKEKPLMRQNISFIELN